MNSFSTAVNVFTKNKDSQPARRIGRLNDSPEGVISIGNGVRASIGDQEMQGRHNQSMRREEENEQYHATGNCRMLQCGWKPTKTHRG
jgi:hypothetical protein